MSISGEVWTAFTVLLGIGISATGWVYSRMSKIYDRLDTMVNHMTTEDNKLHTRIDDVRDQYVKREDMLTHMVRIEKTQDAILSELKAQNEAWRHKVGNIEREAVRHDERLKHLEKTP